jgi:hypothetical protein
VSMQDEDTITEFEYIAINQDDASQAPEGGGEHYDTENEVEDDSDQD